MQRPSAIKFHFHRLNSDLIPRTRSIARLSLARVIGVDGRRAAGQSAFLFCLRLRSLSDVRELNSNLDS
jgi:hypothetical protein